MATSAQQTYISRLGFNDPDRDKNRHGLACEYLFERLIEIEAIPAFVKRLQSRCKDFIEHAQLNPRNEKLQKEAVPVVAFLENHQALALKAREECYEFLHPSECINKAISTTRGYVSGFADVLLELSGGYYDGGYILGEVKITKQPAEQVLQQINFYKSQIIGRINSVYVLTDYDCADLQRITQGSSMKVFRLGQRFESWLASREQPTITEL